MTIIAAVRDGPLIRIGCNTSGVSGTLVYEHGPKWLMLDGWAVGVAGKPRTMTIIRANERELSRAIKDGPEAFAECYRNLAVASGVPGKTSDQGYWDGWSEMVLVTARRMFSIDSIMAVIERSGIATCGSGEDCALPAFWSAREAGASIERAFDIALRAAIKFDLYCSGDVWKREVTA